MTTGLTGLGTSSQTQGATGSNTSASGLNTASQTDPYGPSTNYLSDLLNQSASAYQGGYNYLPPNEQALYSQAYGNVGAIPNFGPAASQTANNILQTGGDPTGILGTETQNLSPIAGMGANGGAGLDPTQTPGMQNVLNTIQNDVSNSVNGQFAGAGRSLSGLNEQTLSRGLAQGEAVPLLNQYNSNVSNMLGANSQLGGVQTAAMGNIGNAFNYAAAAPGLASLNPLTQEGIIQQANLQPFNYLAPYAAGVLPIAGLGGTTSGTQSGTGSVTSVSTGSGTATNSPLTQLAQGLGLLSPVGGLLSSLGL